MAFLFHPHLHRTVESLDMRLWTKLSNFDDYSVIIPILRAVSEKKFFEKTSSTTFKLDRSILTKIQA